MGLSHAASIADERAKATTKETGPRVRRGCRENRPPANARAARCGRSRTSLGTPAALSTKPLRMACQLALQTQPIRDTLKLSTKEMFPRRATDERAKAKTQEGAARRVRSLVKLSRDEVPQS